MGRTRIYGLDPDQVGRLLSLGTEGTDGERRSGPEPTAAGQACIERPGDWIGRYRLLTILGEGGMGTVYLAEQEGAIKRQVALKMIKPGMDSKRVIARFEAERQALALLDHPNIAQVYDAGTTESGRPYFVMEHVKGLPVTEYCDRHKLTIDARLRLFQQVCLAVHHAHQKGIVHRDLKPSNILVWAENDQPIPKIIDFGVAKAISQPLTERTLFTEDSQLLGTPEYMSPEQAEMVNEDIDTRSDIYSLGVLLYELLAGILPYDSQTFRQGGIEQIRKIIRETDPKTPSTRLTTLGEEAKKLAESRRTEVAMLAKRLHTELEWIPLKAMRKERAERYRSAAELADDIENYLTGAPLMAGPLTAGYRFQKLLRRNKVVFAAAAAVTAALVLGIMVSAWQAVRATQAEREQSRLRKDAVAAQEKEAAQRQKAEAETYAADMKAASVAMEQQNYGEVRSLLRNYLPRPGLPELRGVEWRYLWQATQGDDLQAFRHRSGVAGLSVSADQRWLLTRTLDSRLAVWDVAANRITAEWKLPGLEGGVISPTEDIFAYVATDGIHIRELQSQRVVTDLAGAGPSIRFSPDGRWLVGRQDTNLVAWDVASWKPRVLATVRPSGTMYLAFSADSRWVVYADGDWPDPRERWTTEPAFAVDLERPGDVHPLPEVTVGGELRSYACSADGRWLASGTYGGQISIFDFQSGRRVGNRLAHTRFVYGLAFSPDGRTLASGGSDQIIRLWKVGTWEPEGQLAGPENMITELQYSADGQSLFAGSMDGTVRRFPAGPPPPHYRIITLTPNETILGPSRQGEGFWTYDEVSRELHFWDSATNAATRTISLTNRPELDGSFVYTASLRHGRWLCWLGTGTNTQVTVMDLEDSSSVRQVALPGKAGDYWTVSPDGKLLAGSFETSSNTLQSAIWHLDSGSMDTLPADYAPNMPGGSHPPAGGSFSADGRFLSLISCRPGDFSAMIWDVARRQPHAILDEHERFLITVVFSPDGRLVGTCNQIGTTRLWDLASGKECLPPLRGAPLAVLALQFSRDGRSVVGLSEARAVLAWHRENHRQMLMLPGTQVASYMGVLAGNDEMLWWLDLPPSQPHDVLTWPDGRLHARATRLPTLAEIDAIEHGRPQEP